MTRRLRTVTKIFKNMYLSGRTAVQFQFQSPVRTPPAVPRRMPLPSSPLRLAIFISRFLPAATHRPRSKGCYRWLAFPVLNFAAFSPLYPVPEAYAKRALRTVSQRSTVARQEDQKDNYYLQCSMNLYHGIELLVGICGYVRSLN